MRLRKQRSPRGFMVSPSRDEIQPNPALRYSCRDECLSGKRNVFMDDPIKVGIVELKLPHAQIDAQRR